MKNLLEKFSLFLSAKMFLGLSVARFSSVLFALGTKSPLRHEVFLIFEQKWPSVVSLHFVDDTSAVHTECLFEKVMKYLLPIAGRISSGNWLQQKPSLCESDRESASENEGPSCLNADP